MATVVINGVTYNAVPEVQIPDGNGGTAAFYDTTSADALPGNVLAGKTYFSTGKNTGTMPNNGAIAGTIDTKDGAVAIPAGYTSGGSVGLSSAQKALLVSENIKAGVTLFGVPGDSDVVDTNLLSGAAGAPQILNGYKAYVNGALVEGSATFPVISQDSTTKILSIS